MFSYLLLYLSLRCTLCERETDLEPPREADRFAHGRTTVPRWNRLFKPVAQYSLLFPSTGFVPAIPDPEFLWLSRYRCTELEPEPPTPQSWNSAPGTWPGRARIGGGRYRSWKARKGLEETSPQGRAPFCLGAGLQSRPAFDWRGWQAGAGSFGGAELGAERLGQRDEELEEAGREMSAAAGSRERDSAGLAGGGKRGWGFEPGAVAGLALGRAGSAGLSGGRLGRRPRSWPYGGGDIWSVGLWGC